MATRACTCGGCWGSPPEIHALTCPMNKSMTYLPEHSVSDQLSLYLAQWLDIASGGRVMMLGGIVTSQVDSGRNFVRFKCKQCRDNWNVGVKLFNNGTAIPSELQDWVGQHKHVCKNYKDNMMGGICLSCGWSNDQHPVPTPPIVVSWPDTSFTKASPGVLSVGSGETVPMEHVPDYVILSRMSVDDLKKALADKIGTEPKKTFKEKKVGRKFRDE